LPKLPIILESKLIRLSIIRALLARSALKPHRFYWLSLPLSVQDRFDFARPDIRLLAVDDLGVEYFSD
jgi:hypothetical protein